MSFSKMVAGWFARGPTPEVKHEYAPMQMERTYGIDLSDTDCPVVVTKDGYPVVLVDRDGTLLLPEDRRPLIYTGKITLDVRLTTQDVPGDKNGR